MQKRTNPSVIDARAHNARRIKEDRNGIFLTWCRFWESEIDSQQSNLARVHLLVYSVAIGFCSMDISDLVARVPAQKVQYSPGLSSRQEILDEGLSVV